MTRTAVVTTRLSRVTMNSAIDVIANAQAVRLFVCLAPDGVR
ncbi:MAG: hypothetical protein WAN00_17110 [Trebonia sp.]